MNGLDVEKITKSYQSTLALYDVSFQVKVGEIVAVLGPSGCGKSTLLSIIAGLEIPDDGEIFWNGISQGDIPPHKRGFGLMFQDYMLFPHKNVNGNVSFGLEMLGWDGKKIEHRVNEVLQFIGVPDYHTRRISTLSGGEQQRIALARSLAPHPRLLLLDEPISSLDRTLRERLLKELSEILKSMNQTAIYVTHDQEEAFALADRVVVMGQGQISQIGTPSDIYTHPKTEFVARFLGFNNIFEADIHENMIELPFGSYPIGDSFKKDNGIKQLDENQKFLLLIRPDGMSMNSDDDHSCRIECIVQENTFRGSLCRLLVLVNGYPLSVNLPSSSTVLNRGERVNLYFNPLNSIHIFD